jgi:hypothetical protein
MNKSRERTPEAGRAIYKSTGETAFGNGENGNDYGKEIFENYQKTCDTY